MVDHTKLPPAHPLDTLGVPLLLLRHINSEPITDAVQNALMPGVVLRMLKEMEIIPSLSIVPVPNPHKQLEAVRNRKYGAQKNQDDIVGHLSEYEPDDSTDDAAKMQCVAADNHGENKAAQLTHKAARSKDTRLVADVIYLRPCIRHCYAHGAIVLIHHRLL